ncbi:response regulator [uncultured Arthrobacter sp.]|uniref:response regulator n=1 Tax=uncultured Arthrobacter sp. TaxID=114050 RepID=UPI00321680E6
MDSPNYKILIVDDNPVMLLEIEREIIDTLVEEQSFNLSITRCDSFDRAEEELRLGDYDLAILDVREEAQGASKPDDNRGTDIFELVRAAKFLPVIFFTALPQKARQYEARPLISVISKVDLVQLPEAVSAALKSGVSTTVKTINKHVDSVIRSYLWDTVAPSWHDYSDGSPDQVAQLLVARVTRSLQENMLSEVRENLEAQNLPEPQLEADAEVFSPNAAMYYVYPPVNNELVPGALIKQPARPSDGAAEPVVTACEQSPMEWWVVLTPSCDFAQNKVEYVLLAHAMFLDKWGPFEQWKSSQNEKHWQKIEPTLRGGRPRYGVFPAFREIPDLIVDLEQVLAVPRATLANVEIVASLSSPFTEALLTRYSHFRGRIGTPDIDLVSMKGRHMAGS